MLRKAGDIGEISLKLCSRRIIYLSVNLMKDDEMYYNKNVKSKKQSTTRSW